MKDSIVIKCNHLMTLLQPDGKESCLECGFIFEGSTYCSICGTELITLPITGAEFCSCALQRYQSDDFLSEDFSAWDAHIDPKHIEKALSYFKSLWSDDSE